MPEIGATLREARMRARIDVSEIEATTKIRAKYLRALENEEWGLLPGPTFVKSFLRTYAEALGLDGKSMVEEYRLHHERPSDAMLEPIVSTPQRQRRRTKPSGPSRGYMVAVGVIGLIIVALVIALVSGGGSSSNHTTSTAAGTGKPKHTVKRHPGATKPRTSSSSSSLVALSLKPSALVYVCLIGDNGRKLIPGADLPAGESTPTYHARHFEITLGNSSVTMYIDGTPRTVAPSSQAIGYSITKAHGRQPLPAARPPPAGRSPPPSCRPAGGRAGSARAGIVVTGTEVLTGRVSDRNGPWLAERLRELGVDLAYTAIVGDRPEDMRAALAFMAEQGLDVVVTSGGLGPTADDLTAEVVGGFQERPMELDEALSGRIAAIVAPLMKRWPNIDPEAIARANRKQATVPRGATVLEPVGTAPGLVVGPPQSRSGPTIVVLPGPPRELQPMWQTAVQTDALRAALRDATVYEQRTMRLFGITESEIAETLRVAEREGVELGRIEVTTCLKRGEVEIVARYEPDAAEVYAAFAAGVESRPGDTLSIG